MNKNNNNQWETVTTVKTATTRTAADINRKGRHLQVKFGRLAFEQEIGKDPVESAGSPFIPLPSRAEEVVAWADELHTMIDALADAAKNLLEAPEKKYDEKHGPKARGPKPGRQGLRALARSDAERVGAESELAKKEEIRKGKTRASRQERAEKDREIRAKMKKG